MMWMKWVLGVAIFALVTSGILHFFEFFMQPSETNNQIAAKPSITPTPSPISTAGWKTYTNTLAEMSFQYPSTWTVKQLHKKSNRVVDNPKEINTAIFTGPEGTVTLQWGPMGFGGGCDIQYHVQINVGEKKEDICHLVNKQGMLTWGGISNDDQQNPAEMRIESPNTKHNEAVMNKVISTIILLTPVSQTEKAKIDSWIAKNNLNQYGDPKDTVYSGGTPLFDEVTGQSMDRYEYIVNKHPDKPWNK